MTEEIVDKIVKRDKDGRIVGVTEHHHPTLAQLIDLTREVNEEEP